MGKRRRKTPPHQSRPPTWCTGPRRKLRYPSAKAAADRVRWLIATGVAYEHPKGPDGLQAYFCGRCRGWHIGHSKFARTKSRRRAG